MLKILCLDLFVEKKFCFKRFVEDTEIADTININLIFKLVPRAVPHICGSANIHLGKTNDICETSTGFS